MLKSNKMKHSYSRNINNPQNSISIEVRDLMKYFTGNKYAKDIKAIDGISFNVKKGEIFGLLGPNGAGKTTIINILSGLIKPTGGSAFVGGYDVRKDLFKVKELIGVCPQEPAVFKFLKGRENIKFFGDMHLMNKTEIKLRSKKLIEQLNLSDFSNRKVKGYSGGMKRQLNLIIALIHDPQILFLDEPTVGMDPRARRGIWEFIGSLKRSNKTIILTTHYIEEAETLCDRVAIIDYGKLVAIGNPKELMEKHESKNLEDVFIKITGRRILEGI